ncbi:MAG: hypothetical protein R6V83_10060 [Candidatus Thorarchaeota archaeon]
MSVMDLLSYGDNAEVGDHDHAVARTVEDLAVAGVMWRSSTGDDSNDRGRNPIPVNADKAPADSRAYGYTEGGNAGRGRVEHRSFRQLPKL